ncbi:MAG: gliding motility-associated C-terminal domain-containing protein [Flavobacteriales bacterium]|nr:gliding motility-associated C-terminal domain-containing protein [Flavobacteriales bacterium]
MWSNSKTTATITGLSASTYTVTVYDALSCASTKTITVTEPAAALTATPSQTNVACKDDATGTATATPAGGTSPYTYLWSDGQTNQTATGLTDGTYTCTVTDSKSCNPASAVSITITEPASALTASTSQTNVDCKDNATGTATATPSGGTSPYFYLWSDGQTNQTATGLQDGVYACTVTDANGCTPASLTSVTITEPTDYLTASTSQSNVDCKDNATGTATATPSGGTAPYAYMWDDGQTNQTATGLQDGVYHCTVTDANGCTPASLTSVTITEPTDYLTASTSQTNVDCKDNASGTATAIPSGGTAPYTYLWNTGQTDSTATGLEDGVYTCTVTDANGCTPASVTTVSITEPALLTSSTTTSTDARCNAGSDGAGSVIITGGTTPYTYIWSDGQTGSTATGLPIGTYHVTVQDANGCIYTDSIEINQPVEPLNLTTSGSPVSCKSGSDGTASVSGTGGTPGYTFEWGSGETGSNISGLVAGIYSVTGTDANGCTSTGTVAITEPTAEVSFTSVWTDVNCKGGSDGTATFTPTGGTPPYFYAWDNGQTDSTATGLSAGTHVITITDVNGCTSPEVGSVLIGEPNAALAVSAQATQVNCKGGDDGTATAVASGGTTPYSYNWSNGQSTAVATGLSAGAYHVTVTDANSCMGPGRVTVAVTEPGADLSATSTYTNTLCYGSTDGTATALPSGGSAPYFYLWSNGQTTATATGLAAGTYLVTVTDVNGCTLPSGVSVTVGEPTAITATANSTDALCGTGSGNAVVYPSGGTPGYTYQWDAGAGNQTTATATGLTTGNFVVTITDANGCTYDTAIAVQASPPVTATANGSTLLCYGGADGTATVNTLTGIPPYVYLWSNGQTEQTATGLMAGTYQVTLTDSAGCVATTSAAVDQPLELIVNTVGDTTVCDQTLFSLSASPSGGTPGYQYLWSDQNASTTSTVQVVANGSTVFHVTVTDDNNCTGTGMVDVTTDVPPAALFGYKVIPTCDNILLKFSNKSMGANDFEWFLNDHLFSTHQNPNIEVGYNENISVKLIAYFGTCSDTMEIPIELKDFRFYNHPEIPNVFTPNGDGINDVFSVHLDGDLKECTQLMIMNRWGVLVYSPPGGQLAWDGRTAAGLPVTEGTYMYIIRLRETQIAGTVMLLTNH